MPRPTNRTRATVRAAEKDDESSSLTPFFRRFPRLGSAFQTKVPPTVLDAYQPTRQSPVLLSNEYPDVAQSEVREESYMYTEHGQTVTKEPSTAEDHLTNNNLVDAFNQVVQGYGSRGGIRVSSEPVTHGPSAPNTTGTTRNDTATTMTRIFLLSPMDMDRDDSLEHQEHNLLAQQESDQVWISKLMDWHKLLVESTQSTGGRKSRFKRPREAPAVPDLGDTPCVPPTKRTHLEADENLVFMNARFPSDHVPSGHPVPMEQHKWCLNVALSAGRAERGLRKRQRDGELDSWSRIPSTTLPMLGDFRSEPVYKLPALLSASSRSVATIWKAVLAAAEAFEKNLSIVKLDTLLDFFDHVRRLPPPTQVLDETTRIAQTVNECLARLWKACSAARKVRAKWMDLWHSDAVELDSVRKALKMVPPPVLDELEELQRQLSVVSDWQSRLDSALNEAAQDDPDLCRDDLARLESLAMEAEASHGFRCKGLVMLQGKLQKAYEVREKLQSLNETKDAYGTVKTICTWVREIQRLKIRFPEANALLAYSREIDSWVERADIAIRSRMSLSEIEDLIRRGENYRLDLTEYIDKLISRVQQAKTWLKVLESILDLEGGRLEWMSKIRAKLDDGLTSRLHDLACEGARLPVDVEFVQLIHIELDARQWSLKAQKWIPSEGKILEQLGKIEELREHMKKASTLKGRIPQPERGQWKLDLESELTGLVQDADKWLEHYDRFFEGDHRKASSRRTLSIRELRALADSASNIPVNLGAAYAKVDRFRVQAETWYQMHCTLLSKAGLESSVDSSNPPTPNKEITLEQLRSAMDDANSGIAFDLEEVRMLASLVAKLESWFDQVTVLIGASKRRMRGKKTVYTLEGLQKLIDEAPGLPVDTSEAVQALQDIIESACEWQQHVRGVFKTISREIDAMRIDIVSKFGDPATFCRATSQTRKVYEVQTDGSEDIEVGDNDALSGSFHSSAVQILLDEIEKEIASSCVVTPEMEIVSTLEQLVRWVSRSVKYLVHNDEIFDKRFFGAFDRFISEGSDLCAKFGGDNGPSDEFIGLLQQSCPRILNDQLARLMILLNNREEFSSWCAQAEKILSNEDKRCTIDKLRDLNKKAGKFPSDNERVRHIRELTERANTWVQSSRSFIQSEERIKMPELKARIDEGEKLGIQTSELRELRNGMKVARAWSNRVKKCKPELCVSTSSEVQELVDDYDSLMVELPEEIARLNKAMKRYCICRGVNEGQMVTCDSCTDLFHIQCLGLSKLRADKMDKFVCLRCSLKKNYTLSSATISGIVRKWTNEKELLKIRQAEVQKHQRKTRKEAKDISKHRRAIDKIARSIAELDALKSKLIACDKVDVLPAISGGVQKPPEVPKDDGPDHKTATKDSVEVVELTSEETPTRSEERTVADLDAQRNLLTENMQKATKAIFLCQSRIKSLEAAAAERSNREELENAQSAQLRRWCLSVRAVMAPLSKEDADASRPRDDGHVSLLMQAVLEEAEQLCVTMYKDVGLVGNAFKCICWSSRAMQVLRSQPTSNDVEALVTLGQQMKLPDDKALKTLRTMSQRAEAWNLRFRRALTPIPGKAEPFDLSELNELSQSADKIPLLLPYEHRLETVIDDKGLRYCLCGGPSDGRFMLHCDKCENWFHGSCVGVQGDQREEIDNWFCPNCRGSSVDQGLLAEHFHDAYDLGAEENDDDDVASKAPDPLALWPPFGLDGSAAAIEAFGSEEGAKLDFREIAVPVVKTECAGITGSSFLMKNQKLSCGSCLETEPSDLPPSSQLNPVSLNSEPNKSGHLGERWEPVGNFLSEESAHGSTTDLVEEVGGRAQGLEVTSEHMNRNVASNSTATRPHESRISLEATMPSMARVDLIGCSPPAAHATPESTSYLKRASANDSALIGPLSRVVAPHVPSEERTAFSRLMADDTLRVNSDTQGEVTPVYS